MTRIQIPADNGLSFAAEWFWMERHRLYQRRPLRVSLALANRARVFNQRFLRQFPDQPKPLIERYWQPGAIVRVGYPVSGWEIMVFDSLGSGVACDRWMVLDAFERTVMDGE